MDTGITRKLDQFFSKYKRELHLSGDMLIQAGSDNPQVHYLKSGQVKQYIISGTGDEYVLNIYKPIAFFPLMWMVDDSLNNFFYETLSPVEVWKAPTEDVITFLKSEPDVLYDLITRVFRGMDGLFLKMTYLMSGKAYSRILAELIISTKRFGLVDPQTGFYSIDITQKELGIHSGLTRETISREIKILRDKDLIIVKQGKIIIPDLNRLIQEIQQK